MFPVQIGSISFRGVSAATNTLATIRVRVVAAPFGLASPSDFTTLASSAPFTVPFADMAVYPYPLYTLPLSAPVTLKSGMRHFLNITYVSGGDLLVGADYNWQCASQSKVFAYPECTAYYRQGFSWTSRDFSSFAIAANLDPAGPVPVRTTSSFQCGEY
jgi:hypothetical protein